jgi:hypothetical protein
MLLVEDLEIVDLGLEKPLRFRKRHPVLALVAEILGFVPVEVHGGAG